MNGAADLGSSRSVSWGLAFKALVGLARDTGRTDHVFTIISALSGDTLERTYQAFRRTPYGERLLRERPSLAARLADEAWLLSMPEGSLGREYLEFMTRSRITSDGLMAAQEARIDPNAALDVDGSREYVGDRLASPIIADEIDAGQLGQIVAARLPTRREIAFAAPFEIAHVGQRQNVADYLANQFASVSPWRVHGLGVMWFRAIPDPTAKTPKTGTRVERLDADIAAGRAKFILEARVAPGPDGALRSRLVEIRLTERLPVDDPSFKISMFRTGGGLVPTGFRNGVRAILYPVSQLARGLRGG